MDSQRMECGHTEEEHDAMSTGNLTELAREALRADDPQVLYLMAANGGVTFATSLSPQEAAQALREMTDRLLNYAAQLN